MDGYVDLDAKEWNLAGISLSPLKPIFTGSARRDFDEEDFCITPKSEEARIPSILVCPPPPKKRKSASTCHASGVREFFDPPDLETVFIQRAGEA